MLHELLLEVRVRPEQVLEWACFDDYFAFWSAHGFEGVPETSIHNNHFGATTFSLVENSLSMFAIETSPVAMSARGQPSSGFASLLLPIHMRYAYQTNVGELSHSGHDYAVYVRTEQIISGQAEGAFLNLPLDENRLASTLTAMLGGGEETAWALVSASRLLPMQLNGVDYLHVARQLWAVYQQLAGCGDMIASLGLDEAIYRMVAHLLMVTDQPRPAQERGWRHPRKRLKIKETCEWVMANLHEVITLTQLERISGLSARSLQIAFAEQLKTTPMGWVRQQRLAVAHQHLSTGRYTTMEQLAHDCGYATKSLFYRQYKSLYGCTPGETALNSRR